MYVVDHSLRGETVPFSISICCCNDLFAEGIKQLLADEEGDMGYHIRIVDAEKEITEKTDLLITDFHTLSSMSLETLFQRKVGILLLFTGCLPRMRDKHLLGYISMGLVGILFPKTDVTQLKKAVKCVISGEWWFTHKKLKDLVTCIKNGEMEFDIPLSMKEVEVVKLICKGCHNKEIMKHLKVSEQAVKNHLNRIYKKVGVTDRLQLALYAIKLWPFYTRET